MVLPRLAGPVDDHGIESPAHPLNSRRAWLRTVCIVANILMLGFDIAIASRLPLATNPQAIAVCVVMAVTTALSFRR